MELYLRNINYPYQDCEKINQSTESYLGEFNEQTGWSYQKSMVYADKNGRYQYYFDDNGIRVNSQNYKIDYTKPRIVFIGGSVTFGEELNYKDTFPSIIGDLLENKFEVVNLGVQGFGSAQSMFALKNVIDELKPQYIVYTFIPDHINRNINYDRRLHVKCFEFSGTKPVFAINNGDLKQVGKPQRYEIVDKFKLSLFLSMSYQNFKERSLLKSGESIEITKKIIDEISNIAKKYNIEDYYIYYDTTYDYSLNSWNRYLSNYMFGGDKKERVLNFTNWAEDSQSAGVKYYVNYEDDYHPNATLSAEIAKKFVAKFGQSFDE